MGCPFALEQAQRKTDLADSSWLESLAHSECTALRGPRGDDRARRPGGQWGWLYCQ